MFEGQGFEGVGGIASTIAVFDAKSDQGDLFNDSGISADRMLENIQDGVVKEKDIWDRQRYFNDQIGAGQPLTLAEVTSTLISSVYAILEVASKLPDMKDTLVGIANKHLEFLKDPSSYARMMAGRTADGLEDIENIIKEAEQGHIDLNDLVKFTSKEDLLADYQFQRGDLLSRKRGWDLTVKNCMVKNNN